MDNPLFAAYLAIEDEQFCWVLSTILTVLVGAVLGIIIFRLLSRLDRLSRQLESLQHKRDIVYKFLQSQGKALKESQESILEEILQTAVQATGAAGGALFLIPPDAHWMSASVMEGFFPPLIPPSKSAGKKMASKLRFWHELATTQKVPIEEGLFQDIFLEDRGLCINNAEMDTRLFQSEDADLRVHSLLAVPLRHQETPLGAVVLVNKRGRLGREGAFNEDDRTMVQTLALHAGFSIKISRHFEDLAEKKRLDSDLDIARDIQKLLLPRQWPKVPGLDIVGKSNAAQQVGGDYLDIIQINDKRVAFAIADVSGKGVPGALMMSIFRTQVRSQAKFLESPATLLREVNSDMAGEIKKGMFISAIYGVIDLDSFTIRFARAGHNPPILYQRSNQSLREITPGGMALGLGTKELFEAVLEEGEIPLMPGDAVTFYTDGVTEAQNTEGEEFGLDNLLATMRRSAEHGARGILDHLAHHLTRFSAGVPQNDDITLLILSRPGTERPSPTPRNAPSEDQSGEY